MHQTITREAPHEAASPAEPMTAQPARVQVAPPATPKSSATAAPAAPAAAPRPGYAESAGSMASAAVLLGVAGLFVFNVVFGPLAIGVGVAACRRRTATAGARALALAGAVLGAADLIVLAVIAGVSLASGGFTWHFGA
jgi:hypothetical protein